MKCFKLLMLFSFIFLTESAYSYGKDIVVADFKSCNFTNNLGVAFGAWDRDPADDSQSCSVNIIEEYSVEREAVLEVDYDVDSPNPAYNGIWMKLNKIDFSSSDFLVLWVKGDTSTFKIEIKNKKETGYYYLNNISSAWKEFVIPLSDFRNISDFSDLQELTIVFDDIHASQKEGKIYIDDISFRIKSDEKEESVSKSKVSHGVSLKGVDLAGINLSGVNLAAVDLSHTNMQRVNLYSAVLNDANLSKASLSESDLTGASLQRANMSEIRLDKAVLRKVNLSGANLNNSDLKMSDFTRADLKGASLKNADLRLADLRRADLTGVDFTGAKVGGANLYKSVGLDKATRKYMELNGAININDDLI